jgi:hypothetical protein
VLQDVQKRCNEIVNDYFRERLFGFPHIKAFVASLKEEQISRQQSVISIQ